MPTPPSEFRVHPQVSEDLTRIREHNPNHAERCLEAIEDWERQIQWDRVPQERMTYLVGSGPYNFYREWVGQSGYRIIYEISDDMMTALAVLPKGDDTYDLDKLQRRMDRV